MRAQADGVGVMAVEKTLLKDTTVPREERGEAQLAVLLHSDEPAGNGFPRPNLPAAVPVESSPASLDESEGSIYDVDGAACVDMPDFLPPQSGGGAFVPQRLGRFTIPPLLVGGGSAVFAPALPRVLPTGISASSSNSADSGFDRPVTDTIEVSSEDENPEHLDYKELSEAEDDPPIRSVSQEQIEAYEFTKAKNLEAPRDQDFLANVKLEPEGHFLNLSRRITVSDAIRSAAINEEIFSTVSTLPQDDWKFHITLKMENASTSPANEATMAKVWKILLKYAFQYEIALLKIAFPSSYTGRSVHATDRGRHVTIYASRNHFSTDRGRHVTIYASRNHFSPGRWQKILQGIEIELLAAGVEPGKHSTACRRVPGSQFFSYRNAYNSDKKYQSTRSSAGAPIDERALGKKTQRRLTSYNQSGGIDPYYAIVLHDQTSSAGCGCKCILL